MKKGILKKIDKMIMTELHSICDTYISALEEFAMSVVE